MSSVFMYAGAEASIPVKHLKELRIIGGRTGIDGDALARTSRLVAKVDSAAVQDGFDLYLYGFVADGR